MASDDRSPLGVGLVGAGGFGEFCLAAYREMAEVAVIAVADVDESRARRAAAPGEAVYGDYAALLADPRVDIVAVNTPPFLHGPMAVEAAAAGKHLFVEKPLATSMVEAEAAVAAARAAGVQLSVNYVLRHHPLHRLAAAIAGSGAFGELQHFALENFATDEPLGPGHWFWKRAESGGIHVEHGVHFFDLCNALAGGPPGEVTGLSQRRADGREDRVSATARYGDRLLATFYHSFNQIRAVEQTTIRLGCRRGHLAIEGWIPTRLTLHGLVEAAGLRALGELLGDRLHVAGRFEGEAARFAHGGEVEGLAAAVTAEAVAPDRQGDYRRAIQAGMRDLAGAIREKRPPLVGAADALTSLAVALAARG
jgi:predicted dehydrogenase